MLGGPSLICRGMMVLPALPVPPYSFCPTRCDQPITTFRTAELCVVSEEEQQQQRAGQSSRLGAAGSTGRRAPCLPLHQAARLHPRVSGKLLRTAGPAAWYLHRSQQGCSDPPGPQCTGDAAAHPGPDPAHPSPEGPFCADSILDLLLTIRWDLLPAALCIAPCTQHLNTRSYSFYLSCLKAPV